MSWGRSWGALGRSRAILGPPEAILDRFGVDWGWIWGGFGIVWMDLGSIWVDLLDFSSLFWRSRFDAK